MPWTLHMHCSCSDAKSISSAVPVPGISSKQQSETLGCVKFSKTSASRHAHAFHMNHPNNAMVKTRSKLVPVSQNYRTRILGAIGLAAVLLWLYISFGSSLSNDQPSRDLQQARATKQKLSSDATGIDEEIEMALKSVNFEIFGRVQGVFFRKYTEREANRLKLVGWCMNTRSGTVKGVMQGASAAVASMKKWLQTTGSPHSHIDRAEFTDEKDVEKVDFDKFSIKH